MKNPDIKGLATGIGSLPYKDVQQALDLVFKYTPRIPFWPQLPKRDKREAMVAQFSEGLPCLKFDKELIFNPEDKEKKLQQFYERIINQDAEYFVISDSFASGLRAFYQRLENSDSGVVGRELWPLGCDPIFKGEKNPATQAFHLVLHRKRHSALFHHSGYNRVCACFLLQSHPGRG